MRIVKVSAIASTNSYLREYSRNREHQEDILLFTEVQQKGRGQRGTFWESEPYKNLTFSIFKHIPRLRADQQFYISMAASLAIVEFLDMLGVKRLSVKWPNDILAGSRKICGILIESVIKKNNLEALIIGVGINVNQTIFESAPRATSVMLETGNENEILNIVHLIPAIFEKYVNLFTEGGLEKLKEMYEAILFRRGIASTFKDHQQNTFTAIIEGVSQSGRLMLKKEDETLRFYNFKEIQLLY